MGENKYEGKTNETSGTTNWTVASPQATRPHDDCDCPCEKCADGGEHCGKKPCDCAAQPAAGTTPQAERPRCPTCGSDWENRRLKVSDTPGQKWCKDIWHKSEARAVAPVETPDIFRPPASFNAYQEGNVETRLTAEQFWPEWIKGKGKHLATKSLSEINCEFAEAFGDKSEAELRERVTWLEREKESWHASYENEWKGAARLREEIERLRGELLIHGDLKQYRFRGMTFEELTRKLFRLVDAEAELAALRIDEWRLVEKLVQEARDLVYGMHARTKRLPDYADFRECFKKALSAAPERGKDGKS